MTVTKAVRRARFESAFFLVRDELVAHLTNEGFPSDVVDWYRLSLEYNVQGGKLNRGLSVVDTVEILKGRTLTGDEYTKAAVLGWSVELLQAYFLVADDLMDGSITRRGQPCWYRAPNPALVTTGVKCPPIGLVAVNDAPMLKSAIFQLLKNHFRKESYYVDLIELFNDMAFKTEMGQLIDMITAPQDVVDLNRFSLDRYKTIVQFKTAYYSFHLPVAAAMYMCHIPESYNIRLVDEATMKTIRPFDVALSIFIPLGEYFQIQDDFLDFSAPPEILGKVGTDIVDNKCSWCINTAMKLSTPEQRAVLERNYGRKGDIEAGVIGSEEDVKAEETDHVAGGLCEARIKEVYEAVGLRKFYAGHELQVYEQLNKLIDTIPEEGIIVDENGQEDNSHVGLRRDVFRSFMVKIHGRDYGYLVEKLKVCCPRVNLMPSLSSQKRRTLLAKYSSSPAAEAPLPLASLPSSDLQPVLNSQKYAPGNNDVLEFLGDRVVNLTCALISSKINHSPDQQTLVGRNVSNIDTLGRIARQLRLPQHARARIDPPDRDKSEAWSRRQVGSPPDRVPQK